MAVALYMDHHVPSAITKALRSRKVDVLTAYEDGTSTIPDSLLLDRATELGRALFTQDADLLAEANYRQSRGMSFGGVIYAPYKVVSVGVWVRDLEIIGLAGRLEDVLDQVTYLPL
ncbi:MAG: DUF5615 family PIN-like protein [Chloroflexota bacterium]|nr:DUF5615 family PIN-like protein [Chloroflexota bacterium]